MLHNPENRDQKSTAEQKLYNAIMAKMNTRVSNIEETVRHGDVLRPHDGSKKAKNIPTRKNDENKTFEQTLDSAKINQNFDTELGIFSESNHKNITEMLNAMTVKKHSKKSQNVEIEASFGSFGNNEKNKFSKFFPGIKSHSDFVNLKEFLSQSINPKFKAVEIEDVIEIMENYKDKGTVRSRQDILYPDDKTYERKFRDFKNSIEIESVGVRITKSTEEPITLSEKDVLDSWRPTIKRNRRRTEFKTRNTSSTFFGFKVDVSAITETHYEWNKSDLPEQTRKFFKYEVEIEVISPDKTASDFLTFIDYIYFGLIGNTSSVNWDVSSMELAQLQAKTLFSADDRKKVADIHNILFQDDITRTKWKNNTGFTLFDKTYWNKPVNIGLENLMPRIIDEEKSTFHLQTSYPTIKLNGKRMFLLFTQDYCWLISPPYKISKFGENKNSSLQGTYLDGEFFRNTFHAFDILFKDGNDVRRKWFLERQSLLKDCISSIKPYYGEVELKHFYTKGDIYQRLRDAADDYEERLENDEDSVDGIIVQPSNEYNNKTTFKWKPSHQLTIDFRMTQVEKLSVGDPEYPELTEDNYLRAFVLRTGHESLSFNPRPIKNSEGETITFKGFIILDEGEDYAKWIDTIAECKWDNEKNTFVPIRVRDDRYQPNNFDTATDVWKDIHNPIGLTTVTGQDLVIMRKIHNRIKESSLKKFLKEGDNILDIGSGRGGDLAKWRKMKLGKVYAIEPNKYNSAEFSRRLAEDKKTFKNMPEIELLKLGAEETKKISKKIGDTKLNAIISFFSLTFFGEDKEKYESLFDTIRLIPEGGYFIGAVMDGERTGNLLAEERIIQSRGFSAIMDEIDELKNKADVLLKNPLKNKDDIAKLGKKIDSLILESDSFLSHEEIKKKIKTTEDKLKKERKLLSGLEKEKSRLQKQLGDNSDVEKLREYINAKYTGFKDKITAEDKDLLEKANFLVKKSAEVEKISLGVTNLGSHVERMRKLLDNPEFVPISEGETVTYNNGVFEIKQLSEFDVSDPIGNEIGITITDPTSMVKDQIEWLFNFSVFAERMEDMGFILLEDKFIDGKDVEFLSKEAFAFSALNRLFCFRRSQTTDEVEVLPFEPGNVTLFPTDIEKNLIIKAVPTKNGSFIHAVLSAVDKKYQALSENEKDEYVLTLRRKLAAQISMEEFQQLHAGEMAKRMAYQSRKKFNTDEEAMDNAFEMYKKRLVDENAEVRDISLLEVMSEKLDIAIYIVGVANKGVLSMYYYSSNNVYCTKILDHKTAIVLAKSEEFYLVGKSKGEGEHQFVFKNNDEFLRTMYKRVCEEK
jgi:hypothetical protein